MVFETEETSQVNGDVIRLKIPSAKSSKLQYIDEDTGETLVILDLITAQIHIEKFIDDRGEGQTANWLKDLADWLAEQSEQEITPSQAWFICRDVQHMYGELKKKSNQSLTLLSGITSIPSEDPSTESS